MTFYNRTGKFKTNYDILPKIENILTIYEYMT